MCLYGLFSQTREEILAECYDHMEDEDAYQESPANPEAVEEHSTYYYTNHAGEEDEYLYNTNHNEQEEEEETYYYTNHAPREQGAVWAHGANTTD